MYNAFVLQVRLQFQPCQALLLPIPVLHGDLCLANALKNVVGCRQPSVLTYTTKFMQERVDFLIDNGMPIEAIAKAVVSHPQV